MTKPLANPSAPWSAQKAGRRIFTRDAEWALPWIEKLRAVSRVAPQVLPDVGRAVLDDMIERATSGTAGGGWASFPPRASSGSR